MSGKRQKKVSAEDPFPVRPDQVRNATGTDDPFLQKHLINQVLLTLWQPDIEHEKMTDRFVAAIAQMECIRPQDGIESMLTAQMVGIHNAALDCIRRAMLRQQSSEGRNQNLKIASNLSAIYAQQMSALDKHRGKGQQKVTVEHVHVEGGRRRSSVRSSMAKRSVERGKVLSAKRSG